MPQEKIPTWCCWSKAMKMNMVEFNKWWRRLIIANQAAMVHISPVGSTAKEGWYVDWQFLGQGSQRILFSFEELAAAFDLIESKDSGQLGGKYIREGKWLNIPGQPADFEKDSSISIEIDQTMQGCVRQILER